MYIFLSLQNCLFSLALVAHTNPLALSFSFWDLFYFVFRGKIIVRKRQMRKLSWNAKVIVFWLSDLKKVGIELKWTTDHVEMAQRSAEAPSTPSVYERSSVFFYHRFTSNRTRPKTWRNEDAINLKISCVEKTAGKFSARHEGRGTVVMFSSRFFFIILQMKNPKYIKKQFFGAEPKNYM